MRESTDRLHDGQEPIPMEISGLVSQESAVEASQEPQGMEVGRAVIVAPPKPLGAVLNLVE